MKNSPQKNSGGPSIWVRIACGCIAALMGLSVVGTLLAQLFLY